MARLKDVAIRQGSFLLLKLENGTNKIFRDEIQGCDPSQLHYATCFRYRLVAFHPAFRSFVVAKSYWEGYVVELVSRTTGNHVTLATVPHYSPNGRYLISVDRNEMGREYDLAVWSTRGDPATLEWQYSGPERVFESWSFVGWDGDEHVKLRVTLRLSDDPSVPLKAFDATLVRDEEGWKLKKPTVRKPVR